MRIKEIILYTNQLEKEISFYNQTLGFSIQQQTESEFSVQVGWSRITFKASIERHFYHYCFLIPKNQLLDAKKWMEERLELLDIENGRVIQLFESWNAESIYFLDGSGNIAELIVRHDLDNESDIPFNQNSFLCLNEIGMPTTEIKKINQQLEDEMNSYFWKGSFDRFGTNGTQEGLFLLPNYEIKDSWFPTDLKIETPDFNAVIENNSKIYQVNYNKEQLNIDEFDLAIS